jgi:4-hydroxybenzoyl-CoA thioesterase
MMRFCRTRRIRFSDCDPAGIVFYPQYFVLFNDLVEEWFDALLPGGYAGYILGSRCGLPTVRVEAEFKRVSRMGDQVTLGLQVVRLGSKSLELELECKGDDGGRRMAFKQTLVTTSLETHLSIPIPARLRSALLAQEPGETALPGAQS